MKPALLLLALLVLAGCGGSSQPAIHNPVLALDFPDPFVLRVGDTYYAYATNGNGKQVQTATSNDLVHWTPGPDALPRVAEKWSFNGQTWAPEVLKTGDRYVLYYATNQQIGRAVATTPLGPFVDDSAAPLVAQPQLGGAIDPSPFRDDDGTLYLYWKNDGNSKGLKTELWAQRLSPDGLRVVGHAFQTGEVNDAFWEGQVVEAPEMWKHDGRYYLFYSGSDYASDAYAVGYATCKTALGPCVDAPENPILATTCGAHGPGHNALFETWTAYHSWNAAHTKRQMWISRLEWKKDKPVVDGPC
jgi:beta-xylosidase